MRIDRHQEGPRMRQYKKRQRGKALKIAIAGAGIVTAALLSLGIYRLFFQQVRQPLDDSIIAVSNDSQPLIVSVEDAPSSGSLSDLSVAAVTESNPALSLATTETSVSAGEGTESTTVEASIEAETVQTDDTAYVSGTDATLENESKIDELMERPAYSEDRDFMKRIKDMSLRRKICALIITRPQTFDDNVSENGMTTAIDDFVKQNLKNNPACGLIMNEKNLSYTQQLQSMVSEAEKFGRYELTFPLFIMMYGKDKQAWETALRYNLEAYWENEGVYGNVYELSLAEVLNKYGFNLCCVGDLEEAKREIHDCEVNSIQACIVFPDSESADFASLLKEFDDVCASISTGVEMIMLPANLVNHVDTGSKNDNADSSISVQDNKSIVEVLRSQEELGDVLIMTDALDSSSWEGSSAVSALKAGTDVIITEDFKVTVKAIQEAVENGELTENRINESLYRVYKAKQ